MVALIEKIVKCLVAFVSFVGKVLLEKYPVWLYIVVFLAAVLLFSVISCTEKRHSTQALVGFTEYNGHKFIVFRALDDNHTLAVVHDPDCLCNYVEPLIVDE